MSQKELVAHLSTEVYDSIDSYTTKLNDSQISYLEKSFNGIPTTTQEDFWFVQTNLRKLALGQLDECVPYYTPFWPQNASLTSSEMARFSAVARSLTRTSSYAELNPNLSESDLTRETAEWQELASILQVKNIGACAPSPKEQSN